MMGTIEYIKYGDAYSDVVEEDKVNHPSHYETGAPFECFDVILETQGEEAAMGFCICNAMKYIYRHKRKNGKQDIEKAVWYLNRYLELCPEEAKDAVKCGF